MGFVALAGGVVHRCTRDETPVSGTLLLHNGVVAGVYRSAEQAREAAGQPVSVLDVSGLTVLPGLIDAHVHLFFDGGPDMTIGQRRDLDSAAERGEAYLRAGVTTVRDLGAPMPEILRLRDEFAAGRRSGPRICAAGPIVTVPGGHGSFAGEIVPDGTDLPRAVHRLADAGVDCVKIAVSGGVSTPGSDLFSVQFAAGDLAAAVAAAHARGLPVAAHASNPESVRIAAAAGVDSVEHAVMVDQAALDALAGSHTVLVPTLTATAKGPEFLADPAIPDFVRQKAAVTIPAHRDSIRRAIAAGVPIAAGTDAGSTGTGHALVAQEASELVRCGLSPRLALASVTRQAAALLGLAGHAGTLTTGAAADVVVVEGDPEVDITALGRVRMVLRGGVVAHRVGR